MSNGQNMTKFYLFIFSAQDLIVHGVLMNFLIDSFTDQSNKNKNMIKEIKISSNNGKGNNKNNLLILDFKGYPEENQVANTVYQNQ